MPVRVWLDDERTPPEDGNKWIWIKSSWSAIQFLDAYQAILQGAIDAGADMEADDIPFFAEISFDHDLGGDDTTRPVLDWIIDQEFWPRRFSIHSANPVGARALLAAMRSHAPEGVAIVSWMV